MNRMPDKNVYNAYKVSWRVMSHGLALGVVSLLAVACAGAPPRATAAEPAASAPSTIVAVAPPSSSAPKPSDTNRSPATVSAQLDTQAPPPDTDPAPDKPGVALPGKKVPIGAPPTNAPSVGKANARVVVQVFEDLECPACGMFDPTLMKAVSRDDEVRLVFRHFPLRQHPNAKPAAMAVEEARRQKGNDAFWEMKRRIFATPQLSLEKLEGIAADMKLDAAAFAKAIRATALPAAVVRDLKEAERLKLEGTPAVIVNGQYLTELGEVADLVATFKAAR